MDREYEAAMGRIAQEAATAAVRQTLITVGIDHAHPIEIQKDMATLRELRMLVDDEEFRKDMLHLRRWRKTMDNVQSRSTVMALGLVSLGILGLVVYGFRLRFLGP